MPMKKDEDYGTNADESKNDEYCCFCFKDGRFLDEGITMEQKIENLVEIGIIKLGMEEAQARTMARTTIPGLRRWKGESRDI